MFHFRIHAKFLGLILGCLVVFFGILSYLIIQREARILAQKELEKQHFIAHAVFTDLKQNMMEGRPRSTLALMKSLQGEYGLVRLEVLRRDGSPAFGTKSDRYTVPYLDRVFSTGADVAYLEGDATPLHTILSPLKNENECSGCHGTAKGILGAILISLSMEEINREIDKSKRGLAALLFSLILVIGVVMFFVIRNAILKPIATLHQGADRIGKGDLLHRIDLKTGDEIQDLADAFNVMAGRLEESYSNLENKIMERTAEVEDKAGQLFHYSRNMATISRLSTKVFNADLSLDELLNMFMYGVTKGLGYARAMLCIVDRKRAWLEVKRDTGLNGLLRFSDQPLSGSDPLVQLTRAGKAVVFDDLSRNPDASDFYDFRNMDEPASLAFIPILRHKSRMCWKVRSCIKSECPAHGKTDAPCWLIKDTLCANTLIESYGDKLSYCMTCDMFPVAGILIVATERGKRPLRGRDISALRVLAAEMGAALDNHWLHDENLQMVRGLLELHRVTAEALSELSLDRALEAFTDSALKFSGLDACCFWIASDGSRDLVRKSGGSVMPGLDENMFPYSLPSDRGLLGAAFSGNSVVVDYNASTGVYSPLGAAAAHGMNSLLAMPLKTERGPIGVFSVHKRSGIPFRETEVAAFMLLANQAAMAVNVCKLNEELKNQNVELARSTSLMSGILSSMSNGVMLLDMNGAVKMINLHGAHILRRGRDDIMGRRLSKTMPEAAALETASFIKIDAGSHQEVEIILPDGAVLPIGFSSTYYRGAGGGLEGVIVVFQDLTEIKALQTELLNKERFAAMGRVVAGVAHEIRNPLFGISSIGQIFQRELSNPAHSELVNALLSETRRLNSLVENLLIYGRPMNLRLEPCDLGQLWDEVLDMHAAELEKRNIRIAVNYSVRQAAAYLDPGQIRQVFLNLLRNSLEAVSPGGEIKINLLLEDRYIIFTISDTGPGIPFEAVDRIFDLFYTTKPKGTGLGLAICKKIVQDHGGEIAVASIAGKGATVTVKLPYKGVVESEKSIGQSAKSREQRAES